MARKNKKQSNRRKNIETARQRAAARSRVPAGKAAEQSPVAVVETPEVVPASTPDNIIEITELPEDPLAGEAILQMAETTDSQVAEAVAAEVAAEETAAAGAANEAAGVVFSDVEETAVPAVENADAASGEQAETDKERKRFPLWGKILIGVAAVLIVIAGIGVGVVGHFLSRIGRASDEDLVAASYDASSDAGDTEDEEVSPLDTMDPNDITWYGQTIEPMEDEDIKNILLIGQDRREGDSKEELKRSDAMIIISLNQKTGQIKVCSLMRDMYVQIPGYGGGKLNYSYEKGGMELLDQTIEENLGVTIDNNVEVDFDGFVEAMSVIGNLDIYLSQAEIDFMEAHPTWADDSGADVTTWDLHEGLNSMTPSEYAVFCRLRMIGNNDFERTERQRRVLSAAFNKIIDGGVLSMLSVADSIIPYVTTDMTNGEILGYVYTVVTKGMELSSQYRIPLDGTWTNQTIHRAAVLVCDMETNTKALQEYLYGEEEGVAFTSEEERAQEKESGTYTSDSYSSTSGGNTGSYSGAGSYSSSGSGYSGTSSYSGSSTTTTDATAVVTDPGVAAETVTDPNAVVTDGTAATDGSVVVDPTVTDPAVGAGMDAGAGTADQAAMDAAAAALAAQQAAAAQALAEQAAAAAAAAGTTTTP